MSDIDQNLVARNNRPASYAFFLFIGLISIFSGYHRSLAEYDSYIYLSAINENFIPSLGFGRFYFIKLFTFLNFIFGNLPPFQLVFAIQITNSLFMISAILLYVEAIADLALFSYAKKILLLISLATFPCISFYSFEIITEPLAMLFIMLCFYLSTKKKKLNYIYFLIGMSIHLRETYIFFLPIFLAMNPPKNVNEWMKSFTLFIITASAPIFYQIHSNGSIYVDQIKTAISQTYQIELNHSNIFFLLILAPGLLFAAYQLARFFKRTKPQQIYLLFIIPELIYLIPKTMRPFEKPRYYLLTAIVLLTMAILKLLSKKIKLIHIAIPILLLNMLILTYRSNDQHQKNFDVVTSLEQSELQFTSLIAGPLGQIARATKSSDDLCFRFIKDGWNWPKQELHHVITDELEKGFEILIYPDYLSFYEKIDVANAIKKLPESRYRISIHQKSIRIRQVQSMIIKPRIHHTIYCWD